MPSFLRSFVPSYLLSVSSVVLPSPDAFAIQPVFQGNTIDNKVKNLLPLQGDVLAIEKKVNEREPIRASVWAQGMDTC